MIEVVAGIAGLLLITVSLADAFQTIVLPRTVRSPIRLTVVFYRELWKMWQRFGRLFSDRFQPTVMSVFGPLSLLLLLSTWAVLVIVGFALLHLATGVQLDTPDESVSFATLLYVSGTTFTTLGIGDVTPRTDLARLLIVAESSTGLGFVALVIGYLPVLYQSFSAREISVSLLAGRAGVPPTVIELLRRYVETGEPEALNDLLNDWELWAAELLETHLSYPVLAFYRSQHDRLSWLAALTVILDLSTLGVVGIGKVSPRRARLTYEMARHTAVDLCHVFVAAQPHALNRLSHTGIERLRELLDEIGLPMTDTPDGEIQLVGLRASYEPYLGAMADYLGLTVPPWFSASEVDHESERSLQQA